MFHKWVCSFRECRTNCQGSEDTTYEVYEGDNVLHGWRGSCWLGMEPVISSQEKLGRVQSSAFSVQPHLPYVGWLLGVATGGATRVDWDCCGQLWEVKTGLKWVKSVWKWEEVLKLEWSGEIEEKCDIAAHGPQVASSTNRDVIWYTGLVFYGDTRRYFSNTKFNNNMEKWVWCPTSISTNVIYFLSNMIRKIYYLK